MTRLIQVLGIAATSITVLVVCSEGGGVACEHPADGLPVVENRGPGLWDDAPSFHLLWRRGGMNEGENLAYPAGAAASQSGRLAVVDFQLAELTVIDSDGMWNPAWASRGPGPGELGIPVAVSWVSDDTVAVFDIAESEIEFVTAEGARSEGIPDEFVAGAIASGQVRWAAVDRRGTVFLEVVARLDEPGARQYAIVRQPPGAEVDTVVRVTVPVSSAGGPLRIPMPGFPVPLAAVSGENVYVADPEGRYLVTMMGPSGRPVRHVCRADTAFRLSDAELGQGPVPEGRQVVAENIAEGPKPTQPAAIGRLVAGADGGLWVQRERTGPWDPDRMYGKAGAIHDVLDAEGRYLGTVELPSGVRLQAVRGDTIWGFRRGDLDEIWVEAYELRFEHGQASAGG